MIKEDELKNIVAKKLIECRKLSGLTQLDVANKLNYSDKAVSKWERGESTPDLYTLYRIADLYGVQVEDLIKDSDKPIQPTYASQSKHLFIAVLCAAVVWAGAGVIFLIFKLLGGVFENDWLCFIYPIPISFLIWSILGHYWFNKKTRFVSLTGFVIGCCILAHFLCNAYRLPNVMYVYLAGALIELIVIIFFSFEAIYNRNREKKFIKLLEENDEDKK